MKVTSYLTLRLEYLTKKELQNILNDYGQSGNRVFRVEKMDHCIYEGGSCKYIVYLEQKIKKDKNG